MEAALKAANAATLLRKTTEKEKRKRANELRHATEQERRLGIHQKEEARQLGYTNLKAKIIKTDREARNAARQV